MTAAEAELVRELLEINRPRSAMTLAQRREQYDRADAAFADWLERGTDADADSDADADDGSGGFDPVRVGRAWARWAHKAAAPDRPVVLYLHGGSYTMGSSRSHRHLAEAIGRAAEASVLVLDYRRPPEEPFPAALDDAVDAYRFLQATGVAPRRIGLAGDSAGAGLAIALLQRLREQGEPMPAAVACISPWTDLSCAAPSHFSHAGRDPVLRTEDLRAMGRLYLAGADPRDPLVSPAYADLKGFPPLLIQVGTEEILLDDAAALAERASEAGVEVVHEVWPGMFHVWHYYFPLLGEGREAVAALARFLAAHAAPAPAG